MPCGGVDTKVWLSLRSDLAGMGKADGSKEPPSQQTTRVINVGLHFAESQRRHMPLVTVQRHAFPHFRTSSHTLTC